MRILTSALAAFVLIGTAHAKVVHVDDNASASGDGSSWANAYKYLQDALAAATSGDEIWVAEGTYKPDESIRGDFPHTILVEEELSDVVDHEMSFEFFPKGSRICHWGAHGGAFGGDTLIYIDGEPKYKITIAGSLIKSRIRYVSPSGEIYDGDIVINGTTNLTKTNVVGDGNRTVSFNLVNGVGMYGGFKGTETTRTPLGDGNQTILSGEINEDKTLWSIHVVMGNGLDASTVMNGFRITKGNANGDGDYGNGGGMFLKSSSPTLTNCVFTNNSGGGMYNTYSSPTLTNCVFTGNSAERGGGMYNRNGSSPTFSNCVFTGNSAISGGGGMYNSGIASPTLTNCVFTGNSANNSGGGGMYNYDASSPTLTNCVFTGNSARFGGGMGNHARSSPTLTNCVFTGNSAYDGFGDGYGGGMYNRNGSSPTLTNCMFTGNSAEWDGGGMYNSRHSSSSPTLTNCVFTGNSANNNGGGVHGRDDGGTYKNTIFHQNTSGSGHADLYNGAVPGVPLGKVSYCLVSGGYSGTGNVDGSPLFVNVNDPDGPDDKWFTEDDGLRLKEGSPGVDAGHNASLSADVKDLLGRTRLVGSAVDLGPYEFDPANPPPVLVKTHLIGVSATTSGTATGGGDIEEGKSATLAATPNLGYFFTGWSGDANGTSNPLTITVDTAKNITANFAQDTNDDDGDGLSNYEELVTYGTDKTKADTDGDGLGDKVEIDGGMNARVSDKAAIDVIKANAAAFGLSLIGVAPFSGESSQDQLELVTVATLNTTESNEEFQQNVNLVQQQRNLTVKLLRELEEETNPQLRGQLQNQLDSLQAKLNENNQMMFDTYGFTLNRNYVLAVEKARLLMWATQEEATEIRSRATDLSTSENSYFAGWSWHAWPWVYSDADKGWLYYRSTTAGWAVWRQIDGKWYTFSSSANEWVTLGG